MPTKAVLQTENTNLLRERKSLERRLTESKNSLKKAREQKNRWMELANDYRQANVKTTVEKASIQLKVELFKNYSWWQRTFMSRKELLKRLP